MKNKYKLAITASFKRDFKRVKKRGYDIALIDKVVEKLLLGEKLDEANRDHALTGDWEGYRECHIQPDWLLIYQIIENRLILSVTRTGTHSDLFKK